MTEGALPDRARLVIMGAGIVGCSAAYHLARLGWRDMVVVDQGSLFETGGSTSHAPGGVFQTNFSKMMTDFARYTVELYNGLALDGEPCFHMVGGLEVALTSERFEDLKRKVGVAKSWGVEAGLISPEETRDKVPILDPGQIQGAYWVPSDGIAKAVRAGEAMARMAEGATFHGETMVEGFEVESGRVQAVLTARGRIETEQVLLCAGIWGARIGRMAGVTIPLVPVQHLYTTTAPLVELAGETREVVHPVLRHQDRAMYFRQHADCYGIGSYRHEPLLVDDRLDPDEAAGSPATRAFTPEHFAEGHQNAVELLPPLGHVELATRINGIFSFTPDGMPLIGECPEVGGFWAAEAVWITHAGGVGRAVAEWMAEGTPGMDLREADINRFPAHARTAEYVCTRGAQQYREVYDIIHPLAQMAEPREVRISPFYPRLCHLGGVFFESAGWEQPQWFAANVEEVPDPSWPVRRGWAAEYWSPIQGVEHRAVRERVALCDLSAFAKIEIKGPGALDFLQRVMVSQLDRPVGRITYTCMLDERGGVRRDLIVVRLGGEVFWVLTGAATGSRDLAWLRAGAPAGVEITDITSGYCGLGLWGPAARQVLERVCADDVSNDAFPYFTALPITIGLVRVWALRLSYAGELGWELYAPTESGLGLWDALWAAGRPLGMVPLGNGAFDSLRLEKGYRLWGTDVHAEYNLCEAGLGWTAAMGKGDFVGRVALEEVLARGIDRKLCCLTLDDEDAVVLGKEPILDGEEVLGYVTSANYGYTVGQYIAYGYLPVDYAAPGTQVEVEYFGARYKATVRREPLFDPQRKRMTS